MTVIVYESWLKNVDEALSSINMTLEDWQTHWAFDFRREFDSGTPASEAALKANRFWWQQQNRSMGQDCQRTANCWLPRNHEGECQPLY